MNLEQMKALSDAKEEALKILTTDNVTDFIFYALIDSVDKQDNPDAYEMEEKRVYFSVRGRTHLIGQCELLKTQIITEMRN